MKKFLFFAIVLYSSITTAQRPADKIRIVQTYDSKFQLVNSITGKPVNNQLWDEVDEFANGFARVFLKGKFSFVNQEGLLIDEVKFDDARNFKNHLAAVSLNGKWGFINESGESVIPCDYFIAYDFSDSVTPVYKDKKWLLINTKGEVTTSLDITSCIGFKNGIAKIIKDKKTGVLYPNGKVVFTGTISGPANSIPYHPNATNLIAQCPDNIDFEYGDFTNWQCYLGDIDTIGTTTVITMTPSPPTANRHVVYPRIMPSAIDPFGLFPTNPPNGSNFAVKLGNTSVNAQAERIAYTLHVPLNDSNFSIKYDYAVVLQDPGHTTWSQPRFNAKLIDSATGLYIPCASFEYISTANLPGFLISPVNSSVIYKDWSSVFFSLRGYGGKTIYLEFTTTDCARGAHWGYAYVDVESTCGNPIEVHYDCTAPNATTLTAPPGFNIYNWWNQDFSTLLGTGQQLVLNPGPPIGSIIWLEMIPFNNFGCKDTIMVRFNGDFDAEFDMSAASGCAPQTFTFYNRNLPSLTTIWDFGDGTTSSGDTVTHTYAIPGTYYVTLNVTVPGGCNGSALHPITIYPIPTVTTPSDQTLCAGKTTNNINFNGTPAGTVFNWTNDNPAIGLAASGTGNIPSFTALNATGVPIVATITITPVHLTCPGTPKIFTITVKPTPTVFRPANQSLCNGYLTNAVIFSGTLSGATFTWTNNNTSIGLGASGSGDISAFTAINVTTTPKAATITITPSFSGCTGTPQTFTITVNPTPNVVAPSNQNLCNAANTSSINFTGSVSGTLYNWTNNDISIGLGASGSGNIPAFTAANITNVPVTATITVTPSAAGCPGTPQSFTITVKPTPNVAQPPNQLLCNGTTTNLIAFNGAVAGSTFSWSNNNSSIGLAASGTGDISAFTAVNTGTTPVTATITVTPLAAGCPGAPQTFTITVKPTANVAQPANQLLCNAATTNLIAFNGAVAGSTFSWTNDNTSIGLAGSGNGNIPAFTAINTGNTTVTATITVSPTAAGCPGAPQTFTIAVKPTPNVSQPVNQLLCSGATTNLIAFNGAVAGSTFSWSNDNTSIGLGGSGNGDIPSFTTVNTGTTPVTATITVTPWAAGCPGAPQSFTITVKPTPNVAQPANQLLCNGATTNFIGFNGAVAGSTFNWSNNNTSIGLGGSGNGDIPAFTAVNTSNTLATATVTVTPSAVGCPGAPQTFTIAVKPTPNVAQPANQLLCNGVMTNLIAFNGAVAGSTFSWSNDNTSIGLGASGNGDIPAFTAMNTGTTPVTATTTVTPSAAGCPGAPQSFTITVKPTPNVAQPPNQLLCNGTTTNLIAFNGGVAGSTFSWTNDNTSIGLAANGNGDIPAFTTVNTGNAPVTATITVTPLATGCPGLPQIFTITVKPTPNVAQPPNQLLCNGATTNFIAFNGAVAGSTFSWTNDNTSIGLAGSGNGDIPSFTTVNTGSTPVTATITVTPSAAGCPGAPQSFTITVKPTPNVAQPANQLLCNGVMTNLIAFNGAVAGSTFSWANNNTSIGLAANGTGDISAFSAVNTGTTPVTATITVTPSAAGCPGAPQTFTIAVKPTPNVAQPANELLCNGATTNLIAFNGGVAGSTFSWTNDNTSIGLAASGNGDIPAFTAINTGNAPVTATITVTPSAAGCPGVPQSFTITVKPTPNVAQPANQLLCNGATTNFIAFNSAVAGSTFSWSNDNTSIGLAASGNGDITSFTAVNTGTTSVTASIIVTPSAAGCPGAPQTFTITIKPTPNVAQPADQALCNASTTNLITFNGSVASSTFSWSNNNTSIGLAASGNGDITSFTAVNTGTTQVTAIVTVTPSAEGCVGAPQSFNITVKPTPNVAQPANLTLCNGVTNNAVAFSGTVSGTIFSWTNNNTAIGLAAGGIGNTPSFTAINSGATPVTATISISPSAAGCPGPPSSFIITVNPTPDLAQPPSLTICSGKSTNITAFTGTVTGATYSWTNNNTAIGLAASGNGNIPAFKVINTGSSPSIATVTITPSAIGCAGVPKNFTITVTPLPSVNLGANLNLSTGTVVTLNPVIQNGPIINWAWIPATGLSCDNCPAPVLTVRDNISYTVTVTNLYGCIASDNINVFTFCKDAQVFIPNAFTPDGDGLNDILMVRGKGITVRSFRIFNRWGELVFEKINFNPNDTKYGWDGKVKGVPATPDVFVYTAEVICDNGIIYTYKGNSTLLK